MPTVPGFTRPSGEIIDTREVTLSDCDGCGGVYANRQAHDETTGHKAATA